MRVETTLSPPVVETVTLTLSAQEASILLGYLQLPIRHRAILATAINQKMRSMDISPGGAFYLRNRS